MCDFGPSPLLWDFVVQSCPTVFCENLFSNVCEIIWEMQTKGAVDLHNCFSFYIPSFINCCWMEWNIAVNADLKLNQNYFSFFFKALKLLSLQAMDQDLFSSIFTFALPSGSLEAMGIYGQNCLTENLRPVFQPLWLPFSSPDENWKPLLLRHWQLRKRLSFLLVLTFSSESLKFVCFHSIFYLDELDFPGVQLPTSKFSISFALSWYHVKI